MQFLATILTKTKTKYYNKNKSKKINKTILQDSNKNLKMAG